MIDISNFREIMLYVFSIGYHFPWDIPMISADRFALFSAGQSLNVRVLTENVKAMNCRVWGEEKIHGECQVMMSWILNKMIDWPIQ